jgi:tetratricopeptide (TPR) repeat protein
MRGVFNTFMLCYSLIALIVGVASEAAAQTPLTLPEASPGATVSQVIGLSTVTVSYHRPGVKGRPIWGGLVKYGEVWRAGANENTTISFSDPAKIEGKDLPPGTYGLHMIPTEGDWTIIFSKNFTSWGSYFYKESEDALRITVKPQPAEFQEWLGYEFSDLSTNSGVLSLRWEKLRVPLKLQFETDAIALSHARDVYLRGREGFTWEGFHQAAAYCLRRGINLEEALGWIDRSISINENFTNLTVKAGLLEKLGKSDEAAKVREKAAAAAVTEVDVNNLGYQYLSANNTKEAIDIFRRNVKDHPNSWNAYDSLAEGYAKVGDTKRAIENYTKALNLVKDADNKRRIEEELQKIQKK